MEAKAPMYLQGLAIVILLGKKGLSSTFEVVTPRQVETTAV
jgi:hypothetical protein